MNAEQLTLEVTESSLVSENRQEIRTLEALKQKGVRLSIDDFGTGYSCLSQLQNLPATELKIDKSFIFAMQDSESTRTIIRTTIEMAHALDMEVVAEGIENQESAEMLIALGCDIGQGYMYSRPISKYDLLAWLSNHVPRTLLSE